MVLAPTSAVRPAVVLDLIAAITLNRERSSPAPGVEARAGEPWVGRYGSAGSTSSQFDTYADSAAKSNTCEGA
jgi:hypothetical protein